MAKSGADILTDAQELARRGNLQALTIVGALLLIWLVNLEAGYEKLMQQLGDLYKYEVETGRVSEALKHQSAEATKAAQSISRKTADAIAHGKPVPPFIRLHREIRKAEVNATKLVEFRQNRQTAVDNTRKTLSEKIEFDLGAMRLPFIFNLAPLVWLVVLGFILTRMYFGKRKFWQLVARATAAFTVEEKRDENLKLFDMPVWLAPIPIISGNGDSGSRLAALVDWSAYQKYIPVSVAIAAIALELIVFRVAWIGINTNLVGYYEGYASIPLAIGVACAAIFPMAVILAMCLPPRLKGHLLISDSQVLSTFGLSRRAVALGFLVGSALNLIAAKQGYSQSSRLFVADAAKKATRYVKRRVRFTKVSQQIFPLGLYRHAKSGKLYFVSQVGVIKRGGDRLNPKHLKSISLEALRDEVREGRHLGHLSKMGRDFEELALHRVQSRDYAGAADALLLFVAHGLQVQQRVSLRSIIRQMDLAAGICIRYGLTEKLDALTNLAEGTTAHQIADSNGSERSSGTQDNFDATELKRRVRQWNGNSDQNKDWRLHRWGRDYPLRWDRRVYKV